jgi:hypothetical protein
MNDANESEDFQAVGVKCRDSLISLARNHAGDDWVGTLDDPPKAADFKGWANIIADQLTDAGRLRSYLKAPHRQDVGPRRMAAAQQQCHSRRC